MDRIPCGYILMPRSLPDLVRQTAPCTRAIWFYLMREANFMDSSRLTRGQLVRSYSKIQEDLSWIKGNTRQRYTLNQIKWAFRFLRKYKEVETQRVTRGILITVCNYSYYQNRKNYEHTGEVDKNNYDYSGLRDNSNPEHTETAPEHTEICLTEHTTEHTEPKAEKAHNIRSLDDYKEPERTAEHTPERTEIPSTIHNIHQYRDIIVGSYTCPREVEICPPPPD
jgi:hypothetical protein